MAVAAFFSFSALGQADDVELTGKPYIDMNYGPYLSASIEVAPGNIAYKGIAIRLDDGGYRMYYAACDRAGNWCIASAKTG